MNRSSFEELLDYRRSVFELYNKLRRPELSEIERRHSFAASEIARLHAIRNRRFRQNRRPALQGCVTTLMIQTGIFFCP